MALAGSFAGTLSRAAAAASSFLRAALIFFCAAGISLVFLAAGAMAGSASSTARSRSAAASAFSASRTAAFACLRAGLSDDLGVCLDAGEVVADLVDPVVLAGVLEEVLLPPPRLQPGQDLRRARIGVRGEDLQRHLAVLEEGDLPGLAVILDLDGLLSPGDLPGAARQR